MVERYRLNGGDEAEAYRSLVEAYRFTPRPTLPSAQIAKLLDCYACQACDHDGWAASDACRFVEDLCASLLTGLAGYAEAPWCLG